MMLWFYLLNFYRMLCRCLEVAKWVNATCSCRRVRLHACAGRTGALAVIDCSGVVIELIFCRNLKSNEEIPVVVTQGFLGMVVPGQKVRAPLMVSPSDLTRT